MQFTQNKGILYLPIMVHNILRPVYITRFEQKFPWSYHIPWAHSMHIMDYHDQNL